MKKFDFIFIWAFVLIFHSCQTYSVISIDYLVPAEISFPQQIKRVGIVNNVSALPGRERAYDGLDSIVLVKSEGLIEKYTLNGDPRIATESLSEALAAESYFDEVIIYDMPLQSGGDKSAPHLSKAEVEELIEELDVDMLISLEEIHIKVHRVVHPLDNIGFLGSVDAKVFPKISLYVPQRSTPFMMINGNDSIFWEDIERSKTDARTKIVPDRQLISEASDFAGGIPVKYITPRWNTASRYLYSGGSSQMRDATFFTQKREWDKALPIWQTIFEQQKGKKKLRAASNISLYYEINDDLEKAYEWGQKALELAKISDRITEKDTVMTDITDYARIWYNQLDLVERRDQFMKLKMQMDRFKNDF